MDEASNSGNFLSEFLKETHALFGLSFYNWMLWMIIFVFLSYIYVKIFRVRKLPILKAVIVYSLIAIGAFVLLIFESDAGLPVIYSLTVVIVMMAMTSIRIWLTRLRKK